MSTEDLTNLENSNSIVCIETTRIPLFGGNGSGFFVKPDMIVTNIHGIAPRGPVIVKSFDKKTTWKVEGVAAFDAKNDLVVLKVAGEGTPLPFGNSDIVRDGESISVVGFPDRKYETTEGTVHSIRESDKLIRMKVNTSYGSSGSPVLNDKRQVIGIVVGSCDLYSHAIPSSPLKVLLSRSEIAEPLVKWRKRKPVRSYTKYVQGKWNYSKKRYRKAIVDFDKAIKLNPEFRSPYFERGGVKNKLGDVEGAIDDYNKVIQLNSDHLAAYNNRALAKAELGDHEGAIADYDKIVQLNADDFPAYNNRGLAKAKIGDFEGAIADYDKAIKLNPKGFVYRNRALLWVELGDSESAQGNMENAENLYRASIEDHTQTIKLYPEVDGNYYYRGYVQSKIGALKADQGNTAEAQQLYEASIEDYTQAIERNPEYSSAYNNRAWVKHLLAKSNAAAGNTEVAQALYHAAISDSSEAIKLDPENAIFYHIRGVVKAAMDDAIGAIEDFDIALQLDPEYAKAYFDRALAKEVLGQHDASKVDFERAKELDPDVEKEYK